MIQLIGDHVKYTQLFLVATAATLFAGAVVADNHAVPDADASTKTASARVVPAKATPSKRAALNSVERHAGRSHRPLRPDLGLRRDGAARDPLGGRTGGLRRAAGLQGGARRRRHADGVRGDVRIRPAGDRRDGRVRRVARRVTEGESGAGAAGARGGRSRLRSQHVRRREPRRGDRDQGADRGRQAQGHGEVLRYAGRGRRRRQGLHGARRPVRRRRRRARLAPGRRDPGRHGVEPGDGQPGRRVRGPHGACRGRPLERAQRGRRGRAVHARHQPDARTRQADLPHALRDPRRRRRAERRAGLCEGLAVAA